MLHPGEAFAPRGESIADLDFLVRDAVEGYFAEGSNPRRVQLHFVEDPFLVLA